MANYRLLRNNKESGPFSLDDLIELGLKPYDLVWIEGKSAAWRYPSEVEELKPIAPVVEEQPFDRFYKKQDETKKEVPAFAEEMLKKETSAINPEHEKYIPKKSVYVTMPGQKNTVAKTPIKESLPTSTPAQPTISVSENPAAAQINYSQPLDEIKEMYVKTLYDRKQKIARKSFWFKNLKKAAALFSLVAVGVLAGFILKSNKNKPPEISQIEKASPSQPAVPETTIHSTDTITANSLADPEEKVQPLHQPTGGFVNAAPESRTRPIGSNQSVDKTVNGKIKNETGSSLTDNRISNNSLVARGADTDPLTGERSRSLRNETNESNSNSIGGSSEKKSLIPDEIAKVVSVTSNDYKKVAFGGIRDLQLTVTNDSKYALDNVTVELQYIKPNELPLRTENIQFTSIGPKATSTIRVPDTNRGIKVTFRIINVKSKQLDERVAGN